MQNQTPKKFCSLINFDNKTLDPWRKAMQGYAETYGHIYLISDTETTGTSVIDKETKLFNRVLEWSILFMYKDESGLLRNCLDEGGEPIVIDEPINPFYAPSQITAKSKRSVKKIPYDSIKIHGINEGYLFGENPSVPLDMDNSQQGENASECATGVRPQTMKIAGTFGMVFETIKDILSSDPYRNGNAECTLVFHNAPFDISFLNSECEIEGMSLVESHFSVIDTLTEAKSIVPQSEIGDYSLNSGFKLMSELFPDEVKPVSRPVHTALIDANILASFYNGLVLYNKRYA
jgi:DNA polymerase III epsilon subunit-like protein